jgi:predicted metalloprotease
MKWKRGRGRALIEDRRAEGPADGGGSSFGFGGGGGFPIPVGGSAIGGGLLLIVIVVVLLTTLLGGGNSPGTSNSQGGSAPSGRVSGAPDPDADLVDFVGFVVDDVQTFWRGDFAQGGRTYQATKLVLFNERTQSGCGLASSETGPFYCPADRKVYLDLGFFRELRSRFQAPGDFAEAYVIAHEFGHHVQHLLGTEERVRREQHAHPDQANDLSVRLELQADCYAGVWAHSAYRANELESGDVQEGLTAAAAVGDDRIQRSAGQRVNPETWTHGSSAQRVQWFRAGFARGAPRDCDTFSASL